jgi:hypothetical protein
MIEVMEKKREKERVTLLLGHLIAVPALQEIMLALWRTVRGIETLQPLGSQPKDLLLSYQLD